jgi:hypothetical protein
MKDNGVDFVRGAAALHTRPVFALRILALNVGCQPHLLEDFIATGKPLPPEAMAKLVSHLFHGKAAWDGAKQCFEDVVKPPARSHLTGASMPAGS